MLELLKQEANRTLTENGASTYETTGSHCLDLFATAGALRGASDDEIETRFLRAFAEDREIAMKLLFFVRDIRGGLGERRIFRVILKWLGENEPETVRKNLHLVAEYGRYDDLLVLMDTPCEKAVLETLKTQFTADLAALEEGGEVSLLGKWLPSVNASNGETVKSAKRIARAFGMNDAAYRKALVALRAKIRIIENNLRKKEYSFDYEKQPSKALFKYRKAFLRNDRERYGAFIRQVARGEAKMNTGTLMPYEMITPLLRGTPTEDERAAVDATWKAFEDFGNDENAIAVIDGSGSMYCNWSAPQPAAVALSLGLYFAERNRGAFRNHFITFSRTPRLVEIQGKDLWEKVRYCAGFGEVANTDLQKVFELILATAIKHSVPQEEMPGKIYIISDMEFDYCAEDASETNFEYAKRIFREAGYRLPEVVFWNVASRNRQQPVTQNEQGVVLVSGCTPRLFSMIAGGNINPYAFMLEVLKGERYAAVAA